MIPFLKSSTKTDSEIQFTCVCPICSGGGHTAQHALQAGSVRHAPPSGSEPPPLPPPLPRSAALQAGKGPRPLAGRRAALEAPPLECSALGLG